MSSSMVCSGFSKSTTCCRAGGTLQHPNTAHTSAQNPRSHRNRLREHGQIIGCPWSSLRFEYAHHQIQFSTSPARQSLLTPALDRLFLPPSLLRRRRSAQSRNLSSISREATPYLSLPLPQSFAPAPRPFN